MSAPVFVIMSLTLREASRRRLLLAAMFLTLVLVAASTWVFGRLTDIPCGGSPCSPTEVKLLAGTLVILITFMYSFVFALGAVFVAVPAVAAEVESGISQAMLPRPLRRSDVILGKWLGWGIIVSGYTIATAGLEFAAVGAITGYTPPYPLIAIAFLVSEGLVMLTLGLLFSTLLPAMAGGIVALVLFGVAWMGGIAHGVGVLLENDAVRNVGLASRILLPADGLWRGALYHLQPTVLTEIPEAGRYLAANPFWESSPPAAGFILWSGLWIALVLALAVLSFERKEL